jgi:hypothetical protein
MGEGQRLAQVIRNLFRLRDVRDPSLTLPCSSLASCQGFPTYSTLDPHSTGPFAAAWSRSAASSPVSMSSECHSEVLGLLLWSLTFLSASAAPTSALRVGPPSSPPYADCQGAEPSFLSVYKQLGFSGTKILLISGISGAWGEFDPSVCLRSSFHLPHNASPLSYRHDLHLRLHHLPSQSSLLRTLWPSTRS